MPDYSKLLVRFNYAEDSAFKNPVLDSYELSDTDLPTEFMLARFAYAAFPTVLTVAVSSITTAAYVVIQNKGASGDLWVGVNNGLNAFTGVVPAGRIAIYPKQATASSLTFAGASATGYFDLLVYANA